MNVEKLEINGVYLFSPKILDDDRGFFFEWFSKSKFKELTEIDFEIVQINFSRSKKNVIRGLHFQTPPMDQAKLVAVPRGEVQDIIVDLRSNSKTFGEHIKVTLSEANKNQLYVPAGFAHGFITLSEEAELMYAIDNPYSPAHDGGIRFDSPDLNISWGMEAQEYVLSPKDTKLPIFNKSAKYF